MPYVRLSDCEACAMRLNSGLTRSNPRDADRLGDGRYRATSAGLSVDRPHGVCGPHRTREIRRIEGAPFSRLGWPTTGSGRSWLGIDWDGIRLALRGGRLWAAPGQDWGSKTEGQTSSLPCIEEKPGLDRALLVRDIVIRLGPRSTKPTPKSESNYHDTRNECQDRDAGAEDRVLEESDLGFGDEAGGSGLQLSRNSIDSDSTLPRGLACALRHRRPPPGVTSALTYRLLSGDGMQWASSDKSSARVGEDGLVALGLMIEKATLSTPLRDVHRFYSNAKWSPCLCMHLEESFALMTKDSPPGARDDSEEKWCPGCAPGVDRPSQRSTREQQGTPSVPGVWRQPWSGSEARSRGSTWQGGRR
ncbi:hypothetical protein FA13DRAFT_1722055 [Coprinellus micaceus]|uniref:Uncharacterized protein n=1 Tax=Coprinellus micaceus TaxID=71717 RepID=A0A4Y7RR70_COPMI|nr:hypothetical protein FA13DRAFT_1722055 [Coprinellus micaceus]